MKWSSRWKVFGEKVLPFEVFPFSRFLYHLSTSASARLLMVILPRKNEMAADFQNVYHYNVCLCSSVVLAEVLEHYCNLVLVFFFCLHDSGSSSMLLPEPPQEKIMWMLSAGFPDEMWMLQPNNLTSRPIKRLARQKFDHHASC